MSANRRDLLPEVAATRATRAAERRRSWTGAVIDRATNDGLLYADLTPIERLRAFTELNRRAWGLSDERLRSRTPLRPEDGGIISAAADAASAATADS
jgi:hypothetical protein